MVDRDDDDYGFPEPEPEDDGEERPRGVRFGEGQRRGRGRAKGALNKHTIIHRVAKKRHTVKIGGRKRTMSTVELVLHRILMRAADGDLAAFKLQEAFREKFSYRPPQLRGRLIGGEKLTIEEWEAAYSPSDVNEEDRERMIAENFPYMLAHRRRWLRYERNREAYSTSLAATNKQDGEQTPAPEQAAH